MGDKLVLPQLSRLDVTDESRFYRIAFREGKVDGTAVRELYEVTMQLVDHDNSIRMLVDLTGVHFLPSGGLGMLVTIRKRFLSIGGQLHILVPDEQVKEVFAVTNLDKLLHLYGNDHEAVNAFKH
ncbi:Anti-sigma-B factor antagonist [Poriferisphaera corsica]|uniref:Anti-sigma factor antagonist n=1 Tax=Poriferisphaera corsica TaxID=2528020 RepID=A0A517YZ43_9BACT|nr:STAS domain-containing protein [Poriferisphaera corsica]QDU35496.1 Anti-sigma-B factor antagonist [Poriferisphaera corsica]